MGWQDRENAAGDRPAGANESLERLVLERLGGRLRSFTVDEIRGWLVLQGEASSYHAKQLAQQEVMGLTRTPILANRIAVSVD